MAIASLAVAIAAFAGFAGTDIYLPSVGSATGVAPWYTTVWVYNPNTSPADVTFYLLKREPNPSPSSFTDTIPPGDVRRYDDAVQFMFHQSVFGALRIVSSQKVLVSSRPFGGTSGALGNMFQVAASGNAEDVRAIQGNASAFGNWGVLGSKYNGVLGSATGNAIGVHGQHANGNWGGLGKSNSGAYGQSANDYGVYGLSTGNPGGKGVYGEHVAGNFSYLGSVSYGVVGHSTTQYGGVYGENTNANGTGVYGYHTPSGNYGFLASSQYGVVGRSATSTGVMGETSGTSGTGVFALSSATSGTNYGVFAHSSSSGGFAGYFEGRVHVTGNLSAGGTKSFVIDHPLDPEHKLLYHAAIESHEVLDQYSGNVVTDENGRAEVVLPEWFEAINTDFRYQLTVIGRFAQAIVEEEIHDNRFVIRTNVGNVKVSWEVTGIRKGRWVEANWMPVEEEKPPKEQGADRDPQLWGQPKDKGGS